MSSLSQQKPYFTLLRQALSSRRFDAFRQSSTDQDIDLLERYFWNMVLCEALYPTLQSYEVALRNAIHNGLSAGFNNVFWFDPSKPIWQPIEQTKVTEVLNRLRVSNIQTQSGLRPEELAGRVIAELQLGYWTGLFDRRYEFTLWRRHIKHTFPNMPTRVRTRNILLRRFEVIRRLRNRVFHHEPIWKDPDLQGKHSLLLETLSWISPPLKDTVQLIDRFPQLYAQGSVPYRVHLENSLRSLGYIL
jgi:hypothetical protein